MCTETKSCGKACSGECKKPAPKKKGDEINKTKTNEIGGRSGEQLKQRGDGKDVFGV